MPDLISHAASAFVFRNLASKLRICQKQFFILILLGVFLPDLISRGAMVLAPKNFLVFQYFHTPFACFFQTLIISYFFIKSQRATVFLAITLGWILHQAYDVMQGVLGPGYYFILWPLSSQTFSFGIFPDSAWYYVAFLTTLTALLTNKALINKIKEKIA
mgnify:FL=1|jgi:hypothetical protein|tara:strand:- start:207 stop:686 length:480 start_codon:yes stop_codon:yes gene_type:complete